MRRLILLRHAKSDWPEGLSDLERPLAPRGHTAAPVMGRYLRDELLLPDLALVSPALRTRETWALVEPTLVPGELGVETPLRPIPMRIEPRIYEAPVSRLLDVIQALPDTVTCALLVGHNPGSAELALTLTGFGDRYAAQRMGAKFPTCGLAVLDLPEGGWADLAPRSCRLDRFVTPASLGAGPNS
jgi:phosphohistidine phosphatase